MSIENEDLYTPRAPHDGAYTTLKVDRDGGLVTITLCRPDSLNAMSRTMMLELQHVFGALTTDTAARVVLLRGEGGTFCAGLDLREPRADSEAGVSAGMRAQRRVSEIVIRMRRAPQPIICLLQGAAAGGGFSLALASDVRIGTPDLRMNAAFIRIGLTACDVGSSYFLPRLVGASLASELLLTGNFIAAERALQCGLLSRVVEPEHLLAAGHELAQDMLRNSPLGLRLTKECLNMSLDASSLEAVIAIEDRQQILCARSDDMREGVQAFLEKRDPDYQDS